MFWRFANGLFAGAWDSAHIESIQIDVPEQLSTVAMRADFYDANLPLFSTCW